MRFRQQPTPDPKDGEPPSGRSELSQSRFYLSKGLTVLLGVLLKLCEVSDDLAEQLDDWDERYN